MEIEALLIFAWIGWALVAVGFAIWRAANPVPGPARFGLVNAGVRQIALALVAGTLIVLTALAVYEFGDCGGGLLSRASCEGIADSAGNFAFNILFLGTLLGIIAVPTGLLAGAICEIVTRRRTATEPPPR